jgi:hypothetical protein
MSRVICALMFAFGCVALANSQSTTIQTPIQQESAVPPLLQIADKWEYKIMTNGVITGGGKGVEADLNALGEKGWELVLSAPSARTYESNWVFKRAKP